MNDQDDVRPNSREEAGDARESDAQNHVLSEEEKLDEGLKDSMDASDPPVRVTRAIRCLRRASRKGRIDGSLPQIMLVLPRGIANTHLRY